MKQHNDYPSPSIAVDLAILTIADGALQVFLVERPANDISGWAMPGGFVHIDKSLEETVQRVLQDKTGIANAQFEQLGTYGDVERDPRGRVISIVYLAFCPAEKLTAAIVGNKGQALARITTNWTGETGGPASVKSPDGTVLELAFDHDVILGDVVKRLRGKLDYSSIAFALLPVKFTLLDVQRVHEAILGQKLTKPAFRRKLIDRGLIEPTGKFETGGAYRPAELYQLKSKSEK